MFLVVFLNSQVCAEYSDCWSYAWWNHREDLRHVLFACVLLNFRSGAFLSSLGEKLVTSLDGLLGEKITRRAAIATVAGAAALVATEFALAKASTVAKGSTRFTAAQIKHPADHV